MKPDEPRNYWQEAQDQQTPEPVESLQPATPSAQQATQQLPSAPVITWQAPEYVHFEKGPLWFVLFGFVVLGLIALDIFFLKSYLFSGLVVIMAVAVVIYIMRQPLSLTYALSGDQGLYVGERLYHFDDFKAFGVILDDGHHSILMIPRKRFGPGVSVYFPEESGEQIVDILGSRLPMENLKLDIIDVIVRKLRL